MCIRDSPAVTESPEFRIEGVDEEPERPPDARSDGLPAQFREMEEIHEESSRHIVRTVAVGRIRSPPGRVLHDAGLVGEGVEVLATNRVQRRELTHRMPEVRLAPLSPTGARARPAWRRPPGRRADGRSRRPPT